MMFSVFRFLLIFLTFIVFVACNDVNGSDNQMVENEFQPPDTFMPPYQKIFSAVTGRCNDENISLNEKKLCGTQNFPFKQFSSATADRPRPYGDKEEQKKENDLFNGLDALVLDSLKRVYHSKPEDFDLNINTTLLKLESRNQYYCEVLRPDFQRSFRQSDASSIYLKTYLWVAYRKFLLTGDSKGFARLVDSFLDNKCWNLFDRLYLSPDDRLIINETSNLDDFRFIFAFYQSGKKRDGLAAYFLFTDFFRMYDFEKSDQYKCIANNKFLQSTENYEIDFDDEDVNRGRRISRIRSNMLLSFRKNCMADGSPTSDLCVTQIQSCGVKLKFAPNSEQEIR